MVDPNPNFVKQIGRRIRDARESAGYTQLQLAEKLKISQQIISKIENGRYLIRVELLEAVATLCHVPIEYFFQGSPKTANAMLLFDQLDPSYQNGVTEIMNQLLQMQQVGRLGITYLTQVQDMIGENPT
jgi:transcriptional regulator with XRE-family HTH domain